MPVNIFELEVIARERLSREAYDYYASGAQDEVTLRENRAAYDRLTLAYRVLVDVSRRDMATTVLGQPVAMPLLVAPTAFHRLATPEGEVATARAAGAAGRGRGVPGRLCSPARREAHIRYRSRSTGS